MVEIGKFNELSIVKFVDFGAYLDGGNGVEILLPQKYVTSDMKVGDEIKVFIYNDSEDRLVAVTEEPKAIVGDFAFLQVSEVNQVGAFLEWGLPKDLLVPFREQKVRMEKGRYYIVYVYVDDNSKRIVASAKLDKFLDNTLPQYKDGDMVNILVTKKTDLGYKVIVDNLFWGMIYHNEIFSPVNIGEHHQGHVKNIRSDGKIDILLGSKNKERVSDLTQILTSYMKEHDDCMPFNDASSPDDIKEIFHCSKKDFKKAIGQLLKKGEIEIHESGISLKKG